MPDQIISIKTKESAAMNIIVDNSDRSISKETIQNELRDTIRLRHRFSN